MRAATIARATGADSNKGDPQARQSVEQGRRAEANTYETFATAFVQRDGSGHVEVRRRSQVFHFTFGPETGELPMPCMHTHDEVERQVKAKLEVEILESFTED